MKVSFCITCYDRDIHLLGEALSYVKNQTVKPDETLIIASGIKSLGYNDPDVFNEFLKTLIARYNLEKSDPIRIFTLNDRMLPGGARNVGGELATGDVVCFCDVDDPIHPQKCEIVKRVFDNKNVDALIHNYNLGQEEFIMVSDLDQIPIEKVTTIDSPPSTNIEVPSKLPATQGHMSARKKVLSDIKYKEDIVLGEDGMFCQSIVKSSKYSLYYTPLILINYIT
tara:strand:- start:18 stop:692 length:675 start_codon:yes stop_codon:yes gene_type:complete